MFICLFCFGFWFGIFDVAFLSWGFDFEGFILERGLQLACKC